jgi:hypothetical protein
MRLRDGRDAGGVGHLHAPLGETEMRGAQLLRGVNVRQLTRPRRFYACESTLALLDAKVKAQQPRAGAGCRGYIVRLLAQISRGLLLLPTHTQPYARLKFGENGIV